MINLGYETIAIEKNEKGEIVKVLETKTLTPSECQEQKAKARSYEHKCLVEKNEREKALKEQKEIEQKHFANLKIMVVYSLFNEFVERGELETTQEFEDMFKEWLFDKEKQFDLSITPKAFIDMLERV